MDRGWRDYKSKLGRINNKMESAYVNVRLIIRSRLIVILGFPLLLPSKRNVRA